MYLYRLNISGLTISALVIALFFIILSRLIPRAEMRWWTYGWIANVSALAVTSLFWYAQPPVAWHGLIFAVYLIPKTVYAWLMLRGALEFGSMRPRWLQPSVALPPVLVSALVAVFVLTTRDRLGFTASTVLAVGFGAGALALARVRPPAADWVIVGFGVRAVHAASEGWAYAVNLLTSGPGESAFSVPANALLAAHYSLGIGAEWILAMGCLISVSARMQREVQVANEQMLTAQASLRRLADRDPLTALANRRALPEILRAVQPHGALLVFFDLDGFKRINDEHGHRAGDECLVRFADALTQSFRPSDAVVRYGGDEFLVAVSGLSESKVEKRIDAVRQRALKASLPIRFSAGISRLAAGGKPEDALHAADKAMYRRKASLASQPRLASR